MTHPRLRRRRRSARTAIVVAAAAVPLACGGDGSPSTVSVRFESRIMPTSTTASTAAPVTVAPETVAPSTVGETTPTTTSPPMVPPTTTVAGPATTAAPTMAPPDVGRRLSIVVTGDLLSHIPIIDQAHDYAGGVGYDFAPMFAAVRPTLEAADVAICHLETPLVPAGTEPDPTPPDYGIPAELAAGIRAGGFDRCSLASNHALDKGSAGIDSTLAALDAVGLGHAGMARSPEEAAPTVFDANGVTVAHLSATYGFNGFSPPAGEPWRSNLIDTARIVAEAQRARAAGAEFVIASLHWGSEGMTAVTAEQRRIAEKLTASGAVDLIVGHHAHVLQPIEQVNGRWVVFGLGNFLSAMSESTDCCSVRGQDGMMVRVEVTEQSDGSFVAGQPQAIATFVDRSTYVILPAQAGVDEPAQAGTVGPGALQESIDRTAGVVGAYLVPA